MTSETPESLLAFRHRAFAAGDFGRVWDCYHPDSNFRRAFPDRPAYQEYGGTQLAGRFALTGWQVLRQDHAAGQARVLAFSSFTREGVPSTWFEWIRLQMDEPGWRILEIARVERQHFAGPVEEFDWKDFERLSDMVFF